MGIPLGGGPKDYATTLAIGSLTATDAGGSGITGTTGRTAAAGFYGAFNVAAYGTFAGTVILEKSFDAGTTWIACQTDSMTTAFSFTTPFAVVVNEPEQGMCYRLRCTAFTSGTISVRLSQSTDVYLQGGVSR